MQQIFQKPPNAYSNKNMVLQQPIQQVDQKISVFGNPQNNIQNLQLQQNKTQEGYQNQPFNLKQNNFQQKPQTHHIFPQNTQVINNQVQLPNQKINFNPILQTPQGQQVKMPNDSGSNLLKTEPVQKFQKFEPKKKIIQENNNSMIQVQSNIFSTEQFTSQSKIQPNFNQFGFKPLQPQFVQKQPYFSQIQQQIQHPNQQFLQPQQNQHNLQQIQEEDQSSSDSAIPQIKVNEPVLGQFEPKQKQIDQKCFLFATERAPQLLMPNQFDHNGIKNIVFKGNNDQMPKGQEFQKQIQQTQQIVQESKIQFGNQGQSNIIQQFPEQNHLQQQQNISFPINNENKQIKIENKDYKIIKLLGQGSFGSVYLVEDEQNEKFALKIQKTIKQAEMEILQRFKVKKFKNLVNTIAVQPDRITNEYYVLMEYCETSLQDYILFKRLDPDQCRYIVKQIALGIKELHDLGIIHRDIKPENILIFEMKDPQNALLSQKLYKICDFGLSSCKDYSKTMELGTAHYMPPEQIEGTGYDRSVDIWALGTVIFEIFTGQVMFYAKNRKEIFEQINNISQDEINEKVSKVLCLQNQNYEELVKEMLNRDSKKRPTIDQVLQRLTSRGEKKPNSHHQPNSSPQPHEDQQRKKRSQSGN